MAPPPPPLFVVAAVGQNPEDTAALLELLAGESLFFDVPAVEVKPAPSASGRPPTPSPCARDWHGGKVRASDKGQATPSLLSPEAPAVPHPHTLRTAHPHHPAPAHSGPQTPSPKP